MAQAVVLESNVKTLYESFSTVEYKEKIRFKSQFYRFKARRAAFSLVSRKYNVSLFIKSSYYNILV